MTRGKGPSRPAAETLLVVNADDYGYYACVSRGILEAARAGSVTATGVLANSPLFDQAADQLSSVPSLDVGVHLTLTFGAPLTRGMRKALLRWEGRFPPTKVEFARAVLSGSLSVDRVAEEWEAQLSRCLSAGLRIEFLNTHEHVHLLPGLRRILSDLATRNKIPFARKLRPEWVGAHSLGALLRNATFLAAQISSASSDGIEGPKLLGVGTSGKLNLDYLGRCLRSLPPGGTYELMCHPGRLDRDEVRDTRLLAYHRWDEEREALMSQSFQSWCREAGIRLVGFRDVRKERHSVLQ